MHIFIHLCINIKTKHELQLLHSAHKRLSVSHMPVHVIDFPITITKFSITLPITSYVAILNYNYHYHYFSKVINCNWLQLQITITTSLVCICQSPTLCQWLLQKSKKQWRSTNILVFLVFLQKISHWPFMLPNVSSWFWNCAMCLRLIARDKQGQNF